MIEQNNSQKMNSKVNLLACRKKDDFVYLLHFLQVYIKLYFIIKTFIV